MLNNYKSGFYLLGEGEGVGEASSSKSSASHPKLPIIGALLPNSSYSSLQNSCYECGLRRGNGCGQPKTFPCRISFPPKPKPHRTLCGMCVTSSLSALWVWLLNPAYVLAYLVCSFLLILLCVTYCY